MNNEKAENDNKKVKFETKHESLKVYKKPKFWKIGSMNPDNLTSNVKGKLDIPTDNKKSAQGDA